MSGVSVSVDTKEPDESRFELALEYYVHPAMREVVISAVISTKKRKYFPNEEERVLVLVYRKIFRSLLVFQYVSHVFADLTQSI